MTTQNDTEAWPENPDAGWLGDWASRNDHLIPREFNFRIVREIYQEERARATRSDNQL